MTGKYDWTIIWYDMSSEKKRDSVTTEIDDPAEAVKQAYLLYGGTDNAPAPMVSAYKK